jgi:hypothetical protein
MILNACYFVLGLGKYIRSIIIIRIVACSTGYTIIACKVKIYFSFFCDTAIGLTKIITFENVLHCQYGSYKHVYMWFSKQSNTGLAPAWTFVICMVTLNKIIMGNSWKCKFSEFLTPRKVSGFNQDLKYRSEANAEGARPSRGVRGHATP